MHPAHHNHIPVKNLNPHLRLPLLEAMLQVLPQQPGLLVTSLKIAEASDRVVYFSAIVRN